MTRTQFNAAYYHKYYLDPKTRVISPKMHRNLIRGVVSLVEYWQGSIRSVLDVGSGIGRWKKWLLKHRPLVETTSTELDPGVCEKYGHLQADISKWRLDKTFDLTICQGVLPYLPERECEAAIHNMAMMTHGFIYIEAITKLDIERVVDKQFTDLQVFRRTRQWYIEQLTKYFLFVGGGLFYRLGGPVSFFDLEQAAL